MVNKGEIKIILNTKIFLSRAQKQTTYMAIAISIVAQFACNTMAYANPANGIVVAGDASIDAAQNGMLQINQTSPNAIINWSSFNIADHEHTHFVQPAGGVMLNRIDASNGASQILGQLSATGTLVLINQSGILFGQNARVDVAGIIASTADLSDQSFMSGKYVFDQPGLATASIINTGKIIAREHGLVALLGYGIRNDGLIQARLGTVKLAHGEKFSVDFYGDQLINFVLDTNLTNANVANIGVQNNGVIEAAGGNVLLTAEVAAEVLDQAINMSGIVLATAIEQQAGELVLSNDAAKVSVITNGTANISGAIDVSNSAGTGGDISVQANKTLITNDAQLNASGTTLGGNVILKSTEATNSYGKIAVCASKVGSTGGIVELSSNGILDFDGSKIDARAIANGVEVGTSGNLILDPAFLIIKTSGGAAYSAGANNLFANNVGSTTTLTPASIVSAAVSSNITLQANTDITFVDALPIATASRTLTVQAGRSVFVHNAISTSNGAIAITANDNTATSADRAVGVGNITMSGLGNISAGTSTLNMTIGNSASAPFSPGTIMLLGSALTCSNLTLSSQSAGIVLPAITITGNLSVTARQITQTDILTVPGTSSFGVDTGGSSLTLGLNNALTGAVSFSSIGNADASLTNALATTLGFSFLRSLSLTSGGSVSQTGGLILNTGIFTVTLTTPNTDIILHQDNTLGSLALEFGGTVANIRDVNIRNTSAGAVLPNFSPLTNLRNLTLTFNNDAIALPALTLTNSGGLSVQAGGVITQSGILTVPGASYFTTGNFPITLTQNNALTGPIALTNSGTNNASVTNTLPTILAGSSVGRFIIISNSGAITQTGDLFTPGGTSSFTAGPNAITLNNVGNEIQGSITLSNSGANDVSLINSTEIHLTASSVGRNLTLSCGGGAITQSGILTVPGTSSFTTVGSKIYLTQNNVLTGPISLNNSGPFLEVRLTNNRATILGTSSVGQNLAVTAVGALTQTGILTVPGTSSFAAGANPITLTQNNVLTGAVTLSNSGANDVSLTNNRATSLAASSFGQNLTVISNGALTQSGTVSASGNIFFNAGSSNITLNNLISTGTTKLFANNAVGPVTVGGLQLNTNFANLTGSVAGLTGELAIPVIVNFNTLAKGTHFFDGFDMFRGSTSVITEPLKLLIANNLDSTGEFWNSFSFADIENAFYNILTTRITYNKKPVKRSRTARR